MPLVKKVRLLALITIAVFLLKDFLKTGVDQQVGEVDYRPARQQNALSTLPLFSECAQTELSSLAGEKVQTLPDSRFCNTGSI